MAQITIDIPNANLPLVADALAHQGGYSATITDAEGNTIPNPVTKNAFAKQQVIKYVKNAVKEYNNMLALQATQIDINIT